MARHCVICHHADHHAVDAALVDGAAFRNVSKRWPDISPVAAFRHKRDHLPAHLAQAHAAQEVAAADDLLGQLRDLQRRTLRLLDQAEASGKLGTALMAIREARGNLELLAEMMHELDRRPAVGLLVAPEWQQARAVLVATLAPYPDARAAVAERLALLESR